MQTQPHQRSTSKPNNHSLEFTLKATLLGVLLAIVLAVSNTYLALKIGVLTASSIPAAMLSIAILKLFKKHSILENNLVQTCASSGEAVAGGIVYTAPGLIIIHAWHSFAYLPTFLLTWVGGLLGVLMTIPLRSSFMRNPELRYPEAQAISQVLIAGSKKALNISYLIIAAAIGGVFEIAQTGLKLFADQANIWLTKGQTVLGFGCGFSATLVGAGYLTGFAVTSSILLGAVISHLLLLPWITSHASGWHIATHLRHLSPASYAQSILDHSIRYIGIGAMLAAGIFSLVKMLKPFYHGFIASLSGKAKTVTQLDIRTERDIPTSIVLVSCLLLWSVCFIMFYHDMSISTLIPASNFLPYVSSGIIITLFIALFGFIFAAICAYFSGLVGVTASPGSSVAIATVLLATIIIGSFSHITFKVNPASSHILMMLTIMITSVIMGSACVANNNSQDLKVGSIIGATPWKQQVMLLIGVTVAALVVPYIMQLLLGTYGLSGATNASANSLPAPPAAAMAAITQAAFSHLLPVTDLWYGAAIIFITLILQLIFKQPLANISLIGIAIGIYLPLSSSTPLFIGGLISYLAKKPKAMPLHKQQNNHNGILVACGLVAGAAVTNVLLAIPFSLVKNQQAFNLLPTSQHWLAEILAICATAAISYYLYKKSIST